VADDDTVIEAIVPARAPQTKPKLNDLFKNQTDAPACPNCGQITVRNGACYKCNNCGESLGCS
jgi:ribonucleoside-diphosphate reductase alpha chain